MQSVDFSTIAPLEILAATVVVVLLQIAIRRNQVVSLMLCLAGLTATVSSIALAAAHIPAQVTALFRVDFFGLFFIALIGVATAATALLASGYLARLDEQCGEFYLLLLMAALGACVLVVSRHFASFFMGLEILSISLYTLIAYSRHRLESLEAGIKYLILAAAASAFLLFGMALIYTQTGGLDFELLAATLRQGSGAARPAVLSAGTAMLVVGFGFKLALVPFHMWTADVYQGAPAPATAFVATVSKISVAALMVRLFFPLSPADHAWIYRLFALMAFASMWVGNLLALWQHHLKRILAYSSIAHLGYLMVAFMTGRQNAATVVTFYLIAYGLSVLGCFAVVCVLSDAQGDADHLKDYHGLFFRRPWLGGILALMILSLAGIPLTAGFIGKFLAIATAAGEQLWWLVLTLVLTSGIGLFYYLRVVVALFGQTEDKPEEQARRAQFAVGLPAAVVLTFTTAALILLGLAPGHLIDFISYALSVAG